MARDNGRSVPPPAAPKIYHIVHMDRLRSIVSDGWLWSDAMMAKRSQVGTAIGMADIKQSRRSRPLSSHPGLMVGDCVPFYFCPRSVMLYVIHMANYSGLTYRDGQGPILHLEADFREVVTWANARQRRWAFTTSNAASGYFADYADLAKLDNVNWEAVEARDWKGRSEGKQAELLVETSFPFGLVRRIGLHSADTLGAVSAALKSTDHRPSVEVRDDWYY